MKTITTFALTAALLAGFSASSFAADAPQSFSNVWKPGFTQADDDGRFYADAPVVKKGYNDSLKNVVQTLRSETSKAGFDANDTGFYERSITVKNNPNAKIELLDIRNTWAPGYHRDENGLYYPS